MSKRLALGSDLPALFGNNATKKMAISEEDTPPVIEKNPVHTVNIDSLCSSPYQPRRTFEPNALAELADSIKQQGILQPILVRRLQDDGMYEIIAGERRWKAAQKAGLITVPVIIHNVDDTTAMAFALIENIQRQDLAPIDEALALERLLTVHGLGHTELAEFLSKSRTTITNTLRLLNLEQSVQMLLNEKELEVGHAKVLLALAGQQQEQAAEAVVKQKLSVRATEQLVKRLQQEPSSTLNFTLDTDIEDLKYELSAFLRTTLEIKHTKSGNGKIEIKYKSVNDLKHLLEKIKGTSFDR